MRTIMAAAAAFLLSASPGHAGSLSFIGDIDLHIGNTDYDAQWIDMLKQVIVDCDFKLDVAKLDELMGVQDEHPAALTFKVASYAKRELPNPMRSLWGSSIVSDKTAACAKVYSLWGQSGATYPDILSKSK